MRGGRKTWPPPRCATGADTSWWIFWLWRCRWSRRWPGCGGGAQGGVLPGYHMGSLLRGCCAVALTSLRREGGAGEGDPPTLTRPR
ncbi:hypothetical protein CesoFtcFv8_011958 [Champsocephalus esox]|uniref:Uncharacterized protein n=1 Tax=Champsocephalus esox TaxID=159716 RepID=A0AAN8C242_9TELE|nr:hypothetical protein CesoFtcFv8_011958 [Champsocephalus esox]